MSAQPQLSLETPACAEDMATLVPLSAKSASALPEVAARLARHLEREPSVALGDVAFTYQTGKAHHPFRTALVARSREDLVTQCHAYAARPVRSADAERPAPSRQGRPKVAFLFTGQGAQYAGMGAELHRRSPVFRSAIDRCAGALDALLPSPLRTILFDQTAPRRIHETELTQPALFALEYALAQQWIAWGFAPDVVLGHSLGEWVAACVAGAYRVEDACALVYQRGALMQELCARGAMASVAAPAERVAELVARRGAVVTAYNAPESVVLGGEIEIIDGLVAELESTGVRCTRLSVSHAFHSPLMEPMLPAFAAKVAAAPASALTIPLLSNLDGEERSRVDADYWTNQIRNPVRFTACLDALRARTPDVVIEIGPHPVLSKLAARSLDGSTTVLSSLRRGTGDVRALHENLGRAWSAGLEVPWAQPHDGPAPKRVHVPSYPYQRRVCRIDAPTSTDSAPKQRPAARKPQLDASSDLAAIERVLIATWQEALGVDGVTLDSNFSALGADSLDAVGLLARTKQATGLPLTLEEQYKHKTPGAIARLLLERLASGQLASAPAADPTEVSEAQAPELERAPAPIERLDVAAPCGSRELAHVLVLGGSTFLGAHVVKELLETTAATIDCLVSASDDDLESSLRFYFGDAFALSSRRRVRALRGAPNDPRLGLTPGEWDALCAQLDTVLDLTAADVDAHRAAAGERSLFAAHPSVREHQVSLVRDDDAAPEAQVTQIRVGSVVGHSADGRAARDMARSPFYGALRSVLAGGVVMDDDGSVDVTPVDYAASAIVEIAKLDASQGRTFDVCNPTDGSSLFDSIRAVGYSLTALPQSALASWRGPALPPSFPRVTARHASTALLEGAGVHGPLPDRDLVFRLLRHAIDKGLVTPPPFWGLLASRLS